MTLFHPIKGELTKQGKKFNPLKNKVDDVYTDSKGADHKLDGTERPTEELDNIAEGIKTSDRKTKQDRKENVSKVSNELDAYQKRRKGEKTEKERQETKHTEIKELLEKIPKEIKESVRELPEPKSDISVNNLNKELTSAVETLKIELRGLKTDDVDLSSIEGKLDALVAKEFPEPPKQTDYTSVLNEIKKGLPKDTDTSRIEKLLKKLDKPVFEIPSKLIKDNRIKVEVDRISMGGSGGATGVGLSTEAKQDDMITELQDLAVTVDNVGSAVISGRKTVTTAGTAEMLKTDTTLTQGVVIMALKTNTNNIFVGDSSVDKDSDKQTELEPGESYPSAVDNTNLIYIDVTTNGEGVSFLGS